MTKLHDLADLGQALWFDFIRRSLLTSGELQALVEKGVRGVTSNPAIFEKAIAGSADYDVDIARLTRTGHNVEAIYETLALEDIGNAADVLRPVYDATDGRDGYVSLEVSPKLADDTAGTVADARRLFTALDRPNIMIKVPATAAGIPAITTLIREGININATLIFSQENYAEVAQAYIAGLEQRMADGNPIERVASVASVFVSRVDTAVDKKLDALEKSELGGKAAIANAKIIYTQFEALFDGPRWEKLTAKGARVQRPLWASTGTKNPAYSDTLYVDTLIGPHTVNTAPPATLQAFMDHGTVAQAVDTALDDARAHLEQIAKLGIDLDEVTRQLQEVGVIKFIQAFESLLASIAEKRARFLPATPELQADLGDYEDNVAETLKSLQEQRVVQRIWDHDHSIWKPSPEEITNRLGWLRIAETMQAQIPQIAELVEQVRAGGYTHALLLGMGGSSLAPEVFRKTFGVKAGHLDMIVLDSTDPGSVRAYASRLDPAKTLFVVATKSGGTVETLSFFKFFYNLTAEAVGSEDAGRHFVAITDPGSKLIDIAKQHAFRTVFLNDPNIGGRYSALSYFGLVPAALVGVDLEALLGNAQAMAARCSAEDAAGNDGLRLGAIMGTLAQAQSARDKVTLIASPAIASFGDWVEQLIAESTGKEGKGILPLVHEPLGDPTVYGQDRLFVSMALEGETGHEEMLQALRDAGHPLISIHLHNRLDLGSQFFLWEFATAVAGACLEINPFNQPNVESAKKLARTMVEQYHQQGNLPSGESSPCTAETLETLFAQAKPGDYVAIQAYIQPTEANDNALAKLRLALRDRLHLATTVGYGPRFLHSTGQLHKGDAGNGLFIQITAEAGHDLPIPNEAGQSASDISFGVLERAQALGDFQALKEAGRRAIHVHMEGDTAEGIRRMADLVTR